MERFNLKQAYQVFPVNSSCIPAAPRSSHCHRTDFRLLKTLWPFRPQRISSRQEHSPLGHASLMPLLWLGRYHSAGTPLLVTSQRHAFYHMKDGVTFYVIGSYKTRSRQSEIRVQASITCSSHLVSKQSS
jgi:hypothetical protein